MSIAAVPESVVLLDEQGHSIGSLAKSETHHRDTPLHLAFSCYVFDDAGRVLLTRRALHKLTWPGVWTNSCCGHPAPGEDMADAVRRRVGQELGIELGTGPDGLRLLLPRFRYRAVMDDGVVENEICPVFVATTVDVVCADPDEVDDVCWVPWAEFRAGVLDGSRSVSPWCVEQVTALPPQPQTALARPDSELPPAGRP